MSSAELNFSPDLFGPGVWFLLHTSSLRYPVKPTADDKKHFNSFIRSIQYALPCGGCCRGFKAILEMTKFGAKDLKSRDALFAWTVLAHSLVNKKIGKPERNDPKFWKSQYMKLAN
jgi:hypothetical protein